MEKHCSNEDFVSIVMPAYNSGRFITESIESVVKQTFECWELFVVDDCSNDNTREIVTTMSHVDKRIKLRSTKQNMGPAMARNVGLSEISGKWLSFLDSDDIWLSSKLQKSFNYAKETNASIVFTGFRRFKESTANYGKYISVPQAVTYKELLSNNVIYTSTVLINLSLTGPISMRDTYYDDFDCWLRLLKSGCSARGYNEDLMRYRIVDGSVSNNKMKSAHKVWQQYRKNEQLKLSESISHFAKYAVNGFLKHIDLI